MENVVLESEMTSSLVWVKDSKAPTSWNVPCGVCAQNFILMELKIQERKSNKLDHIKKLTMSNKNENTKFLSRSTQLWEVFASRQLSARDKLSHKRLQAEHVGVLPRNAACGTIKTKAPQQKLKKTPPIKILPNKPNNLKTVLLKIH